MTNSEVSLREFRWPDDYDEVIQLWKLAGVYNPSSDGPDDIREVSKRNPGLFLLAIQPGRGIMGSVIGAFDGRRAFLYHVAVHPDCRREGLGSALMREVEQRLWALGARKIRFMVVKDNTEAMDFYKTLGYDIDTHAIPMSKSQPTKD